MRGSAELEQARHRSGVDLPPIATGEELQDDGMELVGRLGPRARHVLRGRTQNLITAAWSSFVTSDKRLARSAASATDRASFGVVLVGAPLSNNLALAAGFGWTSTTRSPEATSLPAGNRGRRVLDGPSAHGPGPGHSSSGRSWSGPERTRSWPRASFCPGPQRCARPCGGRCRSLLAPPDLFVGSCQNQWRARLITGTTALAPLFSHTTAKPDGLAAR